MFLFTLPLIILIVGYGVALWVSLTGRHLVRRYFLTPVLVSLLITAICSFEYRQERVTVPPGHKLPVTSLGRIYFLPLYALRIAPLALGVCLILNAAGYLTVVTVHRRFFRRPRDEPAPTEG